MGIGVVVTILSNEETIKEERSRREIILTALGTQQIVLNQNNGGEVQ